jgi:hypothetical protein
LEFSILPLLLQRATATTPELRFTDQVNPIEIGSAQISEDQRLKNPALLRAHLFQGFVPSVTQRAFGIGEGFRTVSLAAVPPAVHR